MVIKIKFTNVYFKINCTKHKLIYPLKYKKYAYKRVASMLLKGFIVCIICIILLKKKKKNTVVIIITKTYAYLSIKNNL